jgi:CheY-like chemotaxis protein
MAAASPRMAICGMERVSPSACRIRAPTGRMKTNLPDTIEMFAIMADLRPILLVEDSPRDLELTLQALRKCQLANEIVIARDGVEALDFLYARNVHAGRNTADPAVIMLDLKLPRIDGLEVLEKVKSDPALRHLPIVMLTSSREEQDLVRSYQLGVNAFVVKPVSFKDFYQAIQDLGVFWGILNEPPPHGSAEPALAKGPE